LFRSPVAKNIKKSKINIGDHHVDILKNQYCIVAPSYWTFNGKVNEYKCNKRVENIENWTDIDEEVYELIRPYIEDTSKKTKKTVVKTEQPKIEEVAAVPAVAAVPIRKSILGCDNYTEEDMRKMFKYLKPNRYQSYEDWLKIGMILKNEGFKLDLYVEFSNSEKAGRYVKDIDEKHAECMEKWNTFSNNDTSVSIGTLFKMIESDIDDEEEYHVFRENYFAFSELLEKLKYNSNVAIASLLYRRNPNILCIGRQWYVCNKKTKLWSILETAPYDIFL
jgi:hypothetical protein